MNRSYFPIMASGYLASIINKVIVHHDDLVRQEIKDRILELMCRYEFIDMVRNRASELEKSWRDMNPDSSIDEMPIYKIVANAMEDVYLEHYVSRCDDNCEP